MPRSILFAALIAGLALPAAAQEKPVFRAPPLDGTVTDHSRCVSPRPNSDGNVVRDTDRGPPPPYVPPAERITGQAADRAQRPVLRSFATVEVRAPGASLREVADALASARDRLGEALQAAGLAALAVETLGLRIEPSRVRGVPMQGWAQIGLLLPGAVATPALRDALGAAGTVAAVQYDHAEPNAVAEDLRPALERAARDDAAREAATRGVELGPLLASALTFQTDGRATGGPDPVSMRVEAALTFQMRPPATAGGN